MKDPILFLNDISKRFERDGKSVLALDTVSLSIAAGETLALCGPSGSGKSTLVRIILRLVEPESGQMRFFASCVRWPIASRSWMPAGSSRPAMRGRSSPIRSAMTNALVATAPRLRTDNPSLPLKS